MAECQLPKLNVAGSNPVSRSKPHFVLGTTLSLFGASGAEAATTLNQFSSNVGRAIVIILGSTKRRSRGDDARGARVA